MNTSDFKRKLTAILSADVVGYSRLMGEDEAATVSILAEYRTVLSSHIRKYNGSVLDAKGDNVLAEFDSVVAAVTCAVKIQETLGDRNRDLAENRKMQFRIGINIGDVIEQGETIYGDGVNIAARLEGLAAPGGICIAKSVFDQVDNKLPFRFYSMGRHSVKNISKPVFAYGLDLSGNQGGSKWKFRYRFGKKSALYGLLCLCLIVTGAIIFYGLDNQKSPRINKLSEDNSVAPSVRIPSLAIYPFGPQGSSSSKVPGSENMASDIFSDLSRITGIEVIMVSTPGRVRSPSGAADDQFSSHDALFYLTGNVTALKSDLIFNTHLTDRSNGSVIWSESYSCDRNSTYIVKNDIIWRVLSHLEVKLTALEKQQILASQQVTPESSQAGNPDRRLDDERETPFEKDDLKVQVVFWESIMDADNREMYEEYLKQFPDGIFRQLAQKKIKMLTSQGKTADRPSTKGPEVDIAGPRKSTSADYELVFWQSIEKSMNIELFSDYLIRFPEGLFVSIASARIDELKKVRELPLSKAVSTNPKMDLDEAVQVQSDAATYSSERPLKVAVLPGYYELGSPFLTSDYEGQSCQIITDEMKGYLYIQMADRFCGVEDQQHFKKITSDISNKQKDLWKKGRFRNRETPNLDLVYKVCRRTGADVGLLYSVHLDFSPTLSNKVYVWLVDIETKKVTFKIREVFYHVYDSEFSSALSDIFFDFAKQKIQSDGHRETICWDIVKNWGRQEAYRRYLKYFPDGKFSGIAKLKSES